MSPSTKGNGGRQYEVTFSRLGRSSTGVPRPFNIWATGLDQLAAAIHTTARKGVASKEVEVDVTMDGDTGSGRVVVGGFRTVGEFTVKVLPIRLAIDADCPECGYPERFFEPERGVYGCSSLNPKPCGYESTERTA